MLDVFIPSIVLVLLYFGFLIFDSFLSFFFLVTEFAILSVCVV